MGFATRSHVAADLLHLGTHQQLIAHIELNYEIERFNGAAKFF